MTDINKIKQEIDRLSSEFELLRNSHKEFDKISKHFKVIPRNLFQLDFAC